MFAVILVTIQFLMLAFVGGFARTTLAFTTSSYYLGTNMLFLLTWTLMNAPFKKLTLHALTILLLTFAFTFECNLLFGRFWYSIFNQFTTSYELTLEFIIESSIACFVVLLVMIDYIGIFRYWQIYLLLVPIINFGWSFNYAVLRYGLKIFDGGMANGFLYAGVVSIIIWVLSVRAKHDKFGGYDKNSNNLMKPEIYIREEYYNGYTISLLGGLLGTFFLWPSVNISTSIITGSLTTVAPAIKNNVIFQNTAYSNTLLCLCVGTVSSFILLNRDRIGEQRHKIRCTIDCFINAGIICAYFVDISLNPAAVMGMALISTILTLVLYLYYDSLSSDKLQPLTSFMILIMYYARALFRIVLPLLGSIVAAIVVANRRWSTVQLLDTVTYGTAIYSSTAGMEVAGYFVTLGISIVGGVLSGLGVNLFLYVKENYPEQTKQVQKQKIAQPMEGDKPKQSKLGIENTANTKRLSLSPEKMPNESQLVRSRNINASKHLTDVDFLELDQNELDMFPLFLKPEDKYIDEQETARKMLKQAILSHVKSNYISTKNYISVSKNNNNNVNTNNTANPDSQFETKVNPRRKLQFSIEGQHTLKNNIGKNSSRREYANHMDQNSPKSQVSQIKNQTKEINDLNNISSQLPMTKSDREVMPEFYVNHMRREKSLKKLTGTNSMISEPNKEMSRSKTQQYLAYDPNDKAFKSSISKNKKSSDVPIIERKQSLNPQLKKTESLNIPQNNKPTVSLSHFSIISELDKEQQEQKGKQIGKKLSLVNSSQTKNKLEQKPQPKPEVEDSGSFVMDENQHDIEDSQIS